MSAPGDGLSEHEMAADAFELQYAWVLLHRARPKVSLEPVTLIGVHQTQIDPLPRQNQFRAVKSLADTIPAATFGGSPNHS